MNLRHDVRANAATYFLLILPLALALTSIIVDISGWNSLRDRVQQEADRLALSAAAVLPDEALASAIVQNASARPTIPGLQASTAFLNETSTVRGSVVEVTLSASYMPAFSGLLGHENGGQRFRVTRSATAAIIPTDTVIVFPDGQSLRPGIEPDGTLSIPWGTPGEWPQSEAFVCYGQASPLEDKALIIDWKTSWSSEHLRRWATQACFNPVFSAVKASAIRLSEASKLSGLSRVSVISTPGEKTQNGYAVLRPLTSGPQAGFFAAETGAESAFPMYHERQSGLNDTSCILYSQPPISAIPAYGVPGGVTGEPVNFPPNGSAFPFNAVLRQDFRLQSMTLKQAVYWLPAKLPSDGFAAEPNLTASLDQALQQFLQRDEASLAEESKVRRNLAELTRRQVIAISDALPELSTLAPVLDRFADAKIDVRLAVFSHPQLSSLRTAELLSRRDALMRALNRWPRMKLYTASSADHLEHVITPLLIASVKEAVLRR